MLRSFCRCTTTALTSGLELHHRNQNPELYSTASDNSTTFASRLPPSKSHGTSRKRSVRARPEPPRRNCEPIAAAMKVFVVSDVHSDHDANMDWLRGLSATQYKQDTLICAGDVTDNLEIFQTSMSLLKDKFGDVFFVPGNHDLWCRRKEDNVRFCAPSRISVLFIFIIIIFISFHFFDSSEEEEAQIIRIYSNSSSAGEKFGGSLIKKHSSSAFPSRLCHTFEKG